MSPSQYTTHLRDTFFSRDSVVTSVKQCVKSLSYYTDDPLVSFANVAIQKPLSVTVTTQDCARLRTTCGSSSRMRR
jgi:hypothetical protein